jgi:iron complex outermembrane receptor protein
MPSTNSLTGAAWLRVRDFTMKTYKVLAAGAFVSLLGASGACAESTDAMSLSQVTVSAAAPEPEPAERPTGQAVATVTRELFDNQPNVTIADVLNLVPGVSVIQGNGPRDVSVSVRGSNDRQAFGVRNIQLFEDGFPVTQPDGTGRMDLTDPHAYGAIDVVQGPSSALYGNYATGGAINFHTRSGSDLNGIVAGADFGQFACHSISSG